jgi:F0F1-type ATP synthase assembly protein I
VKRRSVHEEIGESVGAGAEAAGFFATLLSGFLIGYLLDWWLGTEPVLVVLGIIAGSATGFWKMWQYAKAHDEPRR